VVAIYCGGVRVCSVIDFSFEVFAMPFYNQRSRYQSSYSRGNKGYSGGFKRAGYTGRRSFAPARKSYNWKPASWTASKRSSYYGRSSSRSMNTVFGQRRNVGVKMARTRGMGDLKKAVVTLAANTVCVALVLLVYG